MSDDEQFQVTDSGASLTTKVDTNRLKPGSLVMMKGNPCKVTEVSTAKTGKHGSAKVILKGKDLLTMKVYECTYHAGDLVDAPTITRKEYQLLHVDEDRLELLTADGEVKSDVNLPTEEHLKDVKNKILEIFEAGKNECLVTVIDCMGVELVTECREGQSVE
jgi:translation initiation factor 5A